jgi:hypothetical protein
MSKFKIGTILAVLAALLVIGFAFCFINAFTGNPVSAFFVSGRIRAYAAEQYADFDLSLSKTTYNFKTGSYSSLAQSGKSEDTVFRIYYKSGRISDDYAYEVTNCFTTYRRFSDAFDKLVEGIVAEGFPYETTMVLGDLMGETEALTLDAPFDVHALPMEKSLTVSVLSDVRDDARMAELLLELYHLMKDRGIPVDEYTLVLEQPLPEEEKPGLAQRLYLDGFPAEKITDDTDALIDAIIAHRAEVEQKDKT